jgi:hypothetical protein
MTTFPATPPLAPADPLQLLNSFLGSSNTTGQGFVSNPLPPSSGFGNIINSSVDLPAVSVRKMMRWLVPQGPIVEMYVNPKNISTSYPKLITAQRTKGGYTLQYWGEQLIKLNLSGTTGSSGIEGINVLYNLFRNEQNAFDPYALSLASLAQQSLSSSSSDGFGINAAIGAGTNFISSLAGAFTDPNTVILQQSTPTLASLAFTVELYWSGEVYRGYFENFELIESADNFLFEYRISFVATQKRGFRRNRFPWERSPDFGPSNSDPRTGPPYSYGILVGNGIQSTPVSGGASPGGLSQSISGFGL